MHDLHDTWSFRHESDVDRELAGYSVDALDGHVGRVRSAYTKPGAAYLVVDRGHLFKSSRMIPAGVVDWMDHRARRVVLSMTKAEIRSGPDMHDGLHGDGQLLSTYYEPFVR